MVAALPRRELVRWIQSRELQVIEFVPASCTCAHTTPQCGPGRRGAGEPLPRFTTTRLQMCNEAVRRTIQFEAACDGCADRLLGLFVDPAKVNRVTLNNSSGLASWES